MDNRIIEGGIELLDTIAPLWSKLNQHHSSVSQYFRDFFNSFSFEDRKDYLKETAKNGFLKIAIFFESGKPHGYCIASIQKEEGEIESIFVDENYRNRGVGKQLMTQCMNWLNNQNVVKIKVGVVFGNESAHKFYEKFGLFPRVTYLSTNKKLSN